ncbi:MAG: AraC family transcriptional regulator [Clostridium butyricum]|nr:AraC family transcriptional regulator [Clostridium butyricum]
MNYEELNTHLKNLTKSEKAHKTNTYVSKYNDLSETVIRNNIRAYVFDLSTYIDIKSNPFSGKFTISKHTRFAEVPMHVHTAIELNYVYSGKCEQTINNKHITLKEGQICVIDTDTPHSIELTSENDIIINISMQKSYFSTAFLTRLSQGGIISDFLVNAISDRQSHDNYIIFNSDKNKKIPFLFRELLCEYYDPSICVRDIIDSYMIIIFSELLKVFQNDAVENQTRTSKNPILPILRYLEEHYDSCTLNSTAEHFNFHPNYLSSLIKKSTNQTFKELIQTQRLKHASILLSNSTFPISEVAHKVGYNNLSFFYKKFHLYYKISPKEFRDLYYK